MFTMGSRGLVKGFERDSAWSHEQGFRVSDMAWSRRYNDARLKALPEGDMADAVTVWRDRDTAAIAWNIAANAREIGLAEAIREGRRQGANWTEIAEAEDLFARGQGFAGTVRRWLKRVP